MTTSGVPEFLMWPEVGRSLTELGFLYFENNCFIGYLKSHSFIHVSGGALVTCGESEDDCQESVLSSHRVGPRDQTQIFRLNSKCP